jgi:hypothetical protein
LFVFFVFFAIVASRESRLKLPTEQREEMFPRSVHGAALANTVYTSAVVIGCSGANIRAE